MRLSIFSLASLAVLVSTAPLAPILETVAESTIPGQFIVVMTRDTTESAFQAFLQQFNIPLSTPSVSFGSFRALHGSFEQSLIDYISTSLLVSYIEPVVRMKSSEIITQPNAPWGLARISHIEKGASDYLYDSSAGEGTFAYIIDTGIFTDHEDFEGRATFGANLAGDGEDFDGNGHGTHCSGTIGSKTYGVSKKVQLIGIKVLNAQGSGASSGVIQGIEFAVRDAQQRGRIGKAVGSMSLGGIFSKATNDAVAAAVDAGLFMAVAAGNDGAPAFLTSPASEPKACTVGATDKDDNRASYSNYGNVVDIFAPGTDILSTWIGGRSETKIISGTSMATPHVAGLAAYLLGLQSDTSLDPAAVCDQIKKMSNKNVIKFGGVLLPFLTGTPNQLAYNM